MTEIKQGASNATITRSPGFLEVYSNGVNLRITEYDMSLVFMRTAAVAGGVSSNEEQVAITMSPQTFKVMALTVLTILNGYEKEMGEIKIFKDPDLSQIQSVFAQLAKKST